MPRRVKIVPTGGRIVIVVVKNTNRFATKTNGCGLQTVPKK